jgi:carbon-monoxide dehydrogenase medium subunit
MKAAPFAYHRPDSVKEAADLLDEFGDDAKILAGGQSLVPMLAMRLTHFENLVDISRIDELQSIDLRDGEVRIGAGTPHAFVGMDDEVADSVPLLTLATPHIGHFQIRTRGTLGGAIAHADPAAEYAAVALALDAQMEAVSSKGTRQIPAGEFFTGLWETSLQTGEILTAVRFPVWGDRSGFAVEEFARRHGDFAIAGAAVAVELDTDDRIARCGIGLLGLGSTPLRGRVAEEAVIGSAVGEISAEEVGRLAIDGLDDIPADLQGSAAYRGKVGATMVARAFASAISEITGASNA